MNQNMPLTKFDSFAEVDFPTGVRLFQDAVNRLFTEPAARPWAPPVDVLENQDQLVLKADLPDVSLKDINIQIEQGTLMIKGERKFEKAEGKGNGYHRIERSYGQFQRYFTLPDTVDPDNVKAEYRNGVLTVALAKKEVAKPKSIKVEVAGE
jgi:HSP20 family protein